MIWRESLPARIALATAGLLALVLLLTVSTSYALTAVLLQRGVDNALAAAVPISARSLHEVMEEPQRWQERDTEHRRLQVLDPSGQVLLRPAVLPVDSEALAAALDHRLAFTSVVVDQGIVRPRSGSGWWQAMTPRPSEMRVVYAAVGSEQGTLVLQMAAPLGPAGEVLPVLLRWLLALAVLASLVAGGIAWRMAAESYRPLKAITATASAITGETLSQRIEDRWSDRTLRRLVSVLNAMIAGLQEAFEVQGRFTAAAAHELRSPLAAMRAELEVALRRERSAEEYRQALQGALEETGRLADLAEHLLILSRYERGIAPVTESGMPLQPLLERAANEVRRGTGAPVEVQADAALDIDADPIALERAVANLICNGIQAGGSPVTVCARDMGKEVLIEVEDRGRGIPDDLRSRIFEPFFRGDPARRRDRGTGIGLAIVRAVVEAHHGNITVDSKPGQGTTFRIRLPKHQPGVGG